MDSAKINDWLQVIGVFGVIGSLIFVGMQLKQTQEITLAGQYHSRTVHTLDFYTSLLESGLDWNRMASVPDDLTDVEKRALTIIPAWAWTATENAHYQYKAGFLPEEAWQANFANRVKDGALVFSYFEENKRYFRKAFVACIERLRQGQGDC